MQPENLGYYILEVGIILKIANVLEVFFWPPKTVNVPATFCRAAENRQRTGCFLGATKNY